MRDNIRGKYFLLRTFTQVALTVLQCTTGALGVTQNTQHQRRVSSVCCSQLQTAQGSSLNPIDQIVDKPNCWCDWENSSITLSGLIAAGPERFRMIAETKHRATLTDIWQCPWLSKQNPLCDSRAVSSVCPRVSDSLSLPPHVLCRSAPPLPQPLLPLW